MDTAVLDLLICRVCQLPYVDPRTLNCGHSFCKGCVSWLARRHAIKSAEDEVVCLFCPVCKQVCELSVSKGVEQLHSNQLLQDLKCLTGTQGAPSPPSSTPPRCSTCLKPIRYSSDVAASCCVSCEQLMCNSCAIEHKADQGSSEHRILTIEELKIVSRSHTCTQLVKPAITSKLVFTLTQCYPNNSKNSQQCYPTSLTCSASNQLIVSSPSDGVLRVFAADGNSTEWQEIGKSSLCSEFLEARNNFSTTTFQGHPNRCVKVTPEGHHAIALATSSSLTANQNISNGHVQTIPANQKTSNGHVQGNPAQQDSVVAVIQTTSGQLIQTLSVPPGSAVERLRPFSGSQKEPAQGYGIAVTREGWVVVSDPCRHCLYVFNESGRMVKRFGRFGSRNAQFKSPSYVCVTSSSDVIVSDSGNNCVKIFDLNGKFKKKLGESKVKNVEGGKRGLRHPMGVCCDKYDNLFICDTVNQRLVMYDRQGKYVCSPVDLAGLAEDPQMADIRPLDVASTRLSLLAVLLRSPWVTRVHVYQLRASLPPSSARPDLDDVMAGVRAVELRLASAATPGHGLYAGRLSGRKGKRVTIVESAGLVRRREERIEREEREEREKEERRRQEERKQRNKTSPRNLGLNGKNGTSSHVIQVQEKSSPTLQRKQAVTKQRNTGKQEITTSSKNEENFGGQANNTAWTVDLTSPDLYNSDKIAAENYANTQQQKLMSQQDRFSRGRGVVQNTTQHRPAWNSDTGVTDTNEFSYTRSMHSADSAKHRKPVITHTRNASSAGAVGKSGANGLIGGNNRSAGVVGNGGGNGLISGNNRKVNTAPVSRDLDNRIITDRNEKPINTLYTRTLQGFKDGEIPTDGITRDVNEGKQRTRSVGSAGKQYSAAILDRKNRSASAGSQRNGNTKEAKSQICVIL